MVFRFRASAGRLNLFLGIAIVLVLVHGAYGLWVPSLHRASRKGSLSHVEREIRWGANVNRAMFGYTPLHVAALHGRVEIVDALLRAGANPDGRMGWERESPLFAAIRANQPEICRQLLEAGADPSAGLMPPLVWAITYRGKSCVPWLLEFGADAAALTEDGIPIIFYAVAEEDEFLVAALQEHGASLEQKTREGQSIEEWLSEWIDGRYEASAIEFLSGLSNAEAGDEGN